jgi:Flp pilus assembly protein TadG
MRRPPSFRTSDLGSISAFTALLLVALFALMGLVVDGGTALNARQAAYDEAEQAARVGAGALSVDALRGGVVELDPQAAIAAADAYMVTAGHPGTTTEANAVVTVRIAYRVPTAILGVVGIGSLSVSASASAVDVGGIAKEE